MRVLVLTALLAALLSGCASRLSGSPQTAWTKSERHPALASGAVVRGSYAPMIQPYAPTWFVFSRTGQAVSTLAELQGELRPIDTPELALEYTALLARIQITRDKALTAVDQSAPLEFRSGSERSYAEYTAADAARWGIKPGPQLTDTGAAFVITRPVFRQDWSYEADGITLDWGQPFVEWIRETVRRDGRYEREVLKVLERGEAAAAFQPGGTP